MQLARAAIIVVLAVIVAATTARAAGARANQSRALLPNLKATLHYYFSYNLVLAEDPMQVAFNCWFLPQQQFMRQHPVHGKPRVFRKVKFLATTADNGTKSYCYVSQFDFNRWKHPRILYKHRYVNKYDVDACPDPSTYGTYIGPCPDPGEFLICTSGGPCEAAGDLGKVVQVMDQQGNYCLVNPPTPSTFDCLGNYYMRTTATAMWPLNGGLLGDCPCPRVH